MVCFQYKKLGCFELSILNCNRTISWTQRLNWFSFTGTSYFFCFLPATTIHVIYSSLCRFWGGENGFFTNCFYAHHDAVINMTQWYWAAELIYFQNFSSLYGPPTSKSILLKCRISNTTVGGRMADFQLYRELLLELHLCEPATMFFPLTLTYIVTSFCVISYLQVKTLRLFPHIQTITNTFWFWVWLRFGLIFHYRSPASEHHHLTDTSFWVGILSLVLQFSVEDIFLKCNSDQNASPETPGVSPCSESNIQIL